MTRNLKIVVACGSVVVCMLLLVAWSLPLYRAFCEATGLGGTTRRATEAPAAVAAG